MNETFSGTQQRRRGGGGGLGTLLTLLNASNALIKADCGTLFSYQYLLFISLVHDCKKLIPDKMIRNGSKLNFFHE